MKIVSRNLMQNFLYTLFVSGGESVHRYVLSGGARYQYSVDSVHDFHSTGFHALNISLIHL